MIVLVNTHSPDQINTSLLTTLFASHLAGFSDNRTGARHWPKEVADEWSANLPLQD